MPLRSELLARIPGVVHGFGTMAEPLPSSFREIWNTSRPEWKQVHGNAAAEVVEARQACGETDALWTAVAGVPIAVVTADCVPILLARTDGRRVAAVHAGWRGTRARILRELFARLRAAGESPRDWVAAVGPAIGPCCYEVSENLAEEFAREFGALGDGLAVPRHRYLDLPAINAAELRSMGLREVDLLRACTRCSVSPGYPSRALFHSYRREGGGTRQYSAIMIGA